MIDIIILGIVQGIAEFLPISSSAHLIIFRNIFNIGANLSADLTLTFDIALHFGTLLAIVVYFYKDLLNIFIKGITKGVKDDEGKIFYYIIVATIPAAIIGVLFEDIIENIFRNNLLIIAIALLFMGVMIYLADKYNKNEKEFRKMSISDAFIIGCSQIFALIPGFSRSGTTIATARLKNVNRETAAKFSFYLSAPIVLGAVVLTIFKDNTLNLIMNNLNIFIIGIGVSFITGLLCIEFLLKYLRKNDFKIFMWYRIILAVIILLSLI